MDALTFEAIFLIRNSNGGLCSQQQLVERRVVGDQLSCGVAESDIHDSERHCENVLIAGLGVLSYSQKIVKGYVDKVCYGKLFGIGLWVD